MPYFSVLSSGGFGVDVNKHALDLHVVCRNVLTDVEIWNTVLSHDTLTPSPRVEHWIKWIWPPFGIVKLKC